ncbi:ABC transporter permease [Streptococcus sp. CSL10205-OR2]|uniref:ABC transporter permease n=1 Tax=Streptococcus sp. CSL10205-OR2 TaxID=2980558 RepID=UPI0021D9681F|nr:ABC transporter permease [Streptococcus sp. CSL10205-OR2]MCU9533123.1 ABC transporter permease [Streptococcus sp. CSL10205-OR2]
MISTLIKRHIRLYFSNKMRVIFSMLGALIGYGLYFLFLRDNLLEAFDSLPDANQILDLWMMGGVLATAAISTTLSAVSRFVYDRERQVMADLLLTEVGLWRLQLSYFLSATLVGIVMQIVVSFLSLTTLYLQYQLLLSLPQLLVLFFAICLTSLVCSLMAMLLLYFIKKSSTLEVLGNIVGTLAGFLTGSYISIGVLPLVAQKVLTYTPAIYLSSLYRQILLDNRFDGLTQSMREFLGIGVNWQHLTTIREDAIVLVIIVILISIILILINKFVKKGVMADGLSL